MDWIIDLHSIWRWVVLLVAIGAIVLAVMSATGSRPWDATADRLSLFYTIALDIQFLIGAVVWVVEQRWNGASAFLSWIHPIAMLAAVGIAHAGRTRSDRARDDRTKGTQAALFFGISLVVILIAIPLAAWPL